MKGSHMDFGAIVNQAKAIVDERGGIGALKEDASEVAGIVQGDGSLLDKATQAMAAIKDPGAPGDETAPVVDPTQPAQ